MSCEGRSLAHNRFHSERTTPMLWVYTATPFSANPRMVAASVSASRERNTIHALMEVDIPSLAVGCGATVRRRARHCPLPAMSAPACPESSQTIRR